jgi:transcriptional regulator of acetoin/glycerol metabolism
MQRHRLAPFISDDRSYLRDVADAWDRFVSREPIDDSRVRTVVVESWRRCLRQGVDPLQQSAVESQQTIAAGGPSGSRLLLEAVDRSLPFFLEQVRACDAAILATDKNGVLLTIGGDPAFVERLQSRWAMSGASWLESELGTNAVGTALTLGRLVSIHSHEHFCKAGKLWNCHAIPVRDPYDGEIFGVLDITHERFDTRGECRQMLVDICSKVEAEIGFLVAREHAHLLATLDGATSQTIAAFDRLGRVIASHGDIGRHGLAIGKRVPGLAALRTEEPPLVGPYGAGEIIRIDGVAGGFLRLPTKAVPSFLRGKTQLAPPLATLVRSSPSLLEMAERAQRFTSRLIPILLLGETGTGKEVVAKAIHGSSQSAEGPFVVINCAAMPRELIGSELFGYADGAFTGGKRGGASGRFEDADGGTLFLDEVGDMPLDLQPYLLRALQDGEIVRLGEAKRRKVRVRVIAATNKPLGAAVQSGLFRMDLFHRLNAATLEVPALRDRIADMPALVGQLLSSLSAEGDPPLELDADLLPMFCAYAWPGNIRELRNVLECMAALSPDGRLQYADLPFSFLKMTPGHENFALSQNTGKFATSHDTDMLLDALNAAGGKAEVAARTLGISRSTFYRRLAAQRPKATA